MTWPKYFVVSNAIQSPYFLLSQKCLERSDANFLKSGLIFGETMYV